MKLYNITTKAKMESGSEIEGTIDHVELSFGITNDWCITIPDKSPDITTVIPWGFLDKETGEDTTGLVTGFEIHENSLSDLLYEGENPDNLWNRLFRTVCSLVRLVNQDFSSSYSCMIYTIPKSGYNDRYTLNDVYVCLVYKYEEKHKTNPNFVCTM